MNNNNSIGAAGEFFVAGELERRGFTCAVALKNANNYDLLAINRETKKQFAIQVKTTNSKGRRWKLSKKNEDLVDSRLIYVFVWLNGLDAPEYHIVPSGLVAKRIKDEHQQWLQTPGAHGQQHNDTPMRIFADDSCAFLDHWEYLESEMG